MSYQNCNPLVDAVNKNMNDLKNLTYDELMNNKIYFDALSCYSPLIVNNDSPFIKCYAGNKDLQAVCLNSVADMRSTKCQLKTLFTLNDCAKKMTGQ